MEQLILGGFFGAFFSFLFIKYGMIYERKNRHYNALVKLEYLLNSTISQIEDNKYTIDFFNKVLNNCFDETKSSIVYVKFQNFKLNNSILLDLTNINLINDLFNYFIDIQKINNDMELMSETYQELRESIIDSNISREDYKKNAEYLVGQLDTLNKFLNHLQEQTIIKLATARILNRSKPFFTRIVLKFSQNRYSKKLSKNLPGEIRKIKKEIENIKKESQEEINKVLK